MSDYIPAGYQSQRLKSVYYPPQQQQSQQQLNPYPQGSQQQYPQGSQQQYPQGSQQQYPQGSQQQYPQGSQQQYLQGSQQQYPQGQQGRPVPVLNKIETAPGVKLVSFQQDASYPPQFQQKQTLPQQSVYMGIPNDLYLVSTRPQGYQYSTQRQGSNANLMGTAGGYNNYGSTQQQYQPQSQQSQQQLNQLPQVAQQQLPPVLVVNAVGGQGSAKALPFQQGVAASIPPQFQQSVYMGMPTARGSANLRVVQSEDNIRTAILNEDGNVVGILEQRSYPIQGAAQQQGQGGQTQQQAAAGAGGATLQGPSSDYLFDSLRGLNSAY